MRTRQSMAFLLAMVSTCWLASEDQAFTQDPANPRVTRTVEIIRQIEEGVVAIFSQGSDQTLQSGSGSIIHPRR